jgi:hypothetical protein
MLSGANGMHRPFAALRMTAQSYATNLLARLECPFYYILSIPLFNVVIAASVRHLHFRGAGGQQVPRFARNDKL